MPSSAFPMSSRCAAQWLLLLVVASPAVCQVATAPDDLTKSTAQEICDSQQKTAENQGIISQTDRPPKSNRPLPIWTTVKQLPNGSKEYTFHRDYVVLVYDAERHTTAFYDYDSHADAYSKVPSNGAFLPVLYTKEKFLVRVCNLHPTDTVSIAGNSFTLPEQGADIRGTTPTTAPALAPTLDTLGSASAAGSPFSPAGVNFGSSAPLTSIPISGFTYGSANKDTGYIDAVINVSPEALAFETVSLIRDAQDIVHTIHELNRGDKDKLNGVMEGSIGSLQEQANRLLTNLNNEPPGEDQRLGWFNHRLVETQQLITQLNGLANGVSQAGLGPRAVAMRQNFESIFGILKQIHQVDEDDKKINRTKWAPGTGVSATDSGAPTSKPGTEGNPTTTFNCEDIYNTLVRPFVPSKEPVVADKKSVPADTFTCRAYERYIMTTFLKRYNQKMDDILATIATEQPEDIAKRTKDLFKDQTGMDENVKAALQGMAPALIALTNAVAQQARTNLLKAKWQKAVLETQIARQALIQDDDSIKTLTAELNQPQPPTELADAASQRRQQNSEADHSPAQVAEVIQQSAKEASLSAALTKSLSEVISMTPTSAGTLNEAQQNKAQAQATEAEKGKKRRPIWP